MPIISWPAGSVFNGDICEILLCEEQPLGRPANVTKDFIRTYAKTFFVQIAEYALDPFLVGAAVGIHTGYYTNQPHDVDDAAVVANVSVDDWPNSDGHFWKVTFSFSSNPDATPGPVSGDGGGGGGGGGGSGGGNPAAANQNQGLPPEKRAQNPLAKLADINASSGSYVMFNDTDIEGNFIANIWGFPFTPAEEQSRPETLINASWNMPIAMPDSWLHSKGAVNSSTWVIGEHTIEPLCGSIQSSSSSRVFEEGLAYYRWSISVAKREPFYGKTNQRFIGPASLSEVGPWDTFKANLGLYGAAYKGPNRDLTLDTAVPYRLRDNYGDPLTQPVMLDEQGVPCRLVKYRGPYSVDNLSYYRVFKTRKRVTLANIT
jgi:hypothetical protein